MRPNQFPSIDLIVPVLDEENSLEPFLEEVTGVLEGTKCPYHIIFVDDGSQDQTLAALRRLKSRYAGIKIISLSRNFGKEAALTAGLDHCEADVIIPIDVDLQDPPGLIPEFLECWREGFDIVYGVRTSRLADAPFKRLTASIFYNIFNRLSDVKIPANAGDYRLMDRKVVSEISRLREQNRFMKGLMSWPGFKAMGVPFERVHKAERGSRWGYWRLFNLALNALSGFSTVPLRIWFYVGCVLAMLGFIFALFIVVRVLLFGTDVPGYASIIVSIIFVGGIQLITLGILGEYLGRIFEEVKARPLYVIESIDE